MRQTQARRLASLAASRLVESRWLLGAGALAVVVMTAAADGSPWLAAALVLALFGVALLAPRMPRGRRRAGDATIANLPGLSALSAEDLAAAVSDPLIVFDAAASVVHANAAARAAFGVIDPGMPLLLKFRAPEMRDAIERVRTGGADAEVVDFVERVPIDRAYRVAVSGGAGRRSGLFVLTFKDQSETRRIDRMRADFIANASHELRTPLASIAGFIDTIRGPARNDAAARDNFLQIMQSQAVRMARLIDDLLSLSRLEMKSFLPPDAKVDVRSVVLTVVETLGPLAAESGVTIERQLGDEPVEVRGDRDELIEVFENLLENACKYGQAGGRVIVSLERSETQGQREAAVTVRDFGPGIPAEHIPRITERFYRVDVETSRAQKGTGLGLAIVKHILTRHRARLSIKSQVGVGSSFTVHLPAA